MFLYPFWHPGRPSPKSQVLSSFRIVAKLLALAGTSNLFGLYSIGDNANVTHKILLVSRLFQIVLKQAMQIASFLAYYRKVSF